MGSDLEVTEAALICFIMHLKDNGASMNKLYQDMAVSDPSRTTSSFEHQFRSMSKIADEWRKNGIPDAKNGGVYFPAPSTTEMPVKKGVKRIRAAVSPSSPKTRAGKKTKLDTMVAEVDNENVAVPNVQIENTGANLDKISMYGADFENGLGGFPAEWHPNDFTM